MDGLVVLDKPTGWTSHDAVNRLRRIFQTKKVGHLGTLDPLATGVLPLVIGRATRLAQFFTRNEKGYAAVIRFGQATDSYDADGAATSAWIEPQFTPGELEMWMAEFRGSFLQTPPPVSAKKISGTPAYKLARKQQEVVIPPVEITVSRFVATSFTLPDVRVEVDCGAGTYIRSLAHDLGQRAGCGAHLRELRRTRSGDFGLDQARTLTQLEELAADGRLAEAVIPARDLLPEFPAEAVDALTATQIRQGRDFRVSPFRVRTQSRFVKAISPEGDLVAIGQVTVPHVYHPVLVF